jgi:phosphate transport system protein
MSTPQGPHTSKGYDHQLEQAHALVLQMGARVERQTLDAIECLASGSAALIDQVLRHELVINSLERSIDELASHVIARRQPAANDLRLLIAALKATTDLERIGDEAKKIALQARKARLEGGVRLRREAEVRRMARVALGMLRHALDAFERLDLEGTADVVRRDAEVNDAFRGILRQVILTMIEDPRTISAGLDLVFVAKALERIGDHAKNIAGHAIYAVKGADVRHATVAEIEQELRG